MENLSKRSIYVVTIWREHLGAPDEPEVWRVRVEDARTGERYGFADLDQMTAFLKASMLRMSSRHNEEEQ